MRSAYKQSSVEYGISLQNSPVLPIRVRPFLRSGVVAPTVKPSLLNSGGNPKSQTQKGARGPCKNHFMALRQQNHISITHTHLQWESLHLIRPLGVWTTGRVNKTPTKLYLVPPCDRCSAVIHKHDEPTISGFGFQPSAGAACPNAAQCPIHR